MEGKRLGGRYEIIQRVGGGGMAVVYLAIDQMLERRVAVKVMNDSLSHDQDFIRRFHREAKAAGSLSHPNVVNVYDVGREGDTHYMVMELIKGTSLMETIESRGFIPAEETAHIAIQILEGLGHAHENGIVHRDVKPHNIMATHDGRYKVMDFGVSRLARASTITQTGSVMGSVHYFSPEQAKGAETSSASDLYSLGVVLYEMVTGRLPFDSDEAIAIALKHLQQPVPDPRTIRPELPEPLCQVIFRAMEKDPQDRYQSAQEMIADLKAFLGGQPLGATSAPAAAGGVWERERDQGTGHQNPPEEWEQETVSRKTDPLMESRLTGRKGKKRSGKKRWILAVAAALLLLAGISYGLLGDFQESAAEDGYPEGEETENGGAGSEEPDEEAVNPDDSADSSEPAPGEGSSSPGSPGSSDSSQTPSQQEEPDEYDWWVDKPQGYNENSSFRNINKTGSRGNYNVSLNTSVEGQFSYEVFVSDGKGKRKIKTGQVPVPYSEEEYTAVSFGVSVPAEEIPSRGLIKIVIFSSAADEVEHLLEQWD
ncbi:protein kinase domain-containing protein [Desmospora profundinema]|uniref:Serine/threonine protein kinase n=1 Tax=Desmospora profundinema TaxID=1571184 RepID=A0ABU1IMB8_9BACL|nr:protein kinase [Desmospora profundinema]MDR6225935.1 serine/threonine protein kinase [Desmospora profundinema]